MTDPGEPTASGYMNVANPRVRVDVLLLSSGLCQESGAGKKPGPFPWLTVGPGISPDRASPYCNLAWLRGLTGRFFVRVPITAGGECHPAPKDGLRQEHRSRASGAAPGRLLPTLVTVTHPSDQPGHPESARRSSRERNVFQRPGPGIKAGGRAAPFGQNFGSLINEPVVSTTSFWTFCVCVTLMTVMYVIRLGWRCVLQEGALVHRSRRLVNSLL